MEIRNLRYFLAVAREENMSKAAASLHISQPALSKAIRSLEEELDKKLFLRHSFSIELTDEGVLLRDRAEDLVLMADKIEKEFLFLDPDQYTRYYSPHGWHPIHTASHKDGRQYSR
ncbi:MAG: LysR family transcriptional regulator [Erysipelotrichaceae bacterium]|nr:LysR family transcriptional regulator [Erysipelotrichaceae bacterium]